MTQIATADTFMGTVDQRITLLGREFGFERRDDEIWGFETAADRRGLPAAWQCRPARPIPFESVGTASTHA